MADEIQTIEGITTSCSRKGPPADLVSILDDDTVPEPSKKRRRARPTKEKIKLGTLSSLPSWFWPVAIGGGLLALLFVFRKQAIAAVGVAMNAAQRLIFARIIPDEAKDYADVILRVADEQQVSPFVIVALGMRESRWGAAIGGPGGTGDAGHGHGLMQIDDRSFASWLANNDWRDPYTNVTKGVEILKSKMAFFSGKSPVRSLTDGERVTVSDRQAGRRGVTAGGYADPRPLSGDALTKAAIAAYNTGEGNVLISLAAGVDPDSTTANGDYSGAVLDTVASLQQDFQKAGA